MEAFGQSSVKASYVELAGFILMLLPADEIYFITLVMCCGGRLGSYTKNHEGVLTETEVKNSFAYHFYREICTVIKVMLTAFTGPIGFGESTGRVLVQTEEAINYERVYDEFQKTNELRITKELYDNAKDHYFTTHGDIQGLI